MEYFDYNEVGRAIVGAAFEVMRNSGRGLREKYYEKALAYELRQLGYFVQEQVPIPALYKGMPIDDSYVADLIVEDKIIIELKALKAMNEWESRQLLTYLHLSTYKLGYLINFGAADFSLGSFHEILPYEKGIYSFVNNL